MNDHQDKQQLRRAARSRFFAMAAAYCLGVFNDNYFKQAALLLAVTAGMAKLQGPATVLFSLPFILFSCYAGWVADRFAKRNVVRFSKGLECIAMLIGAAGLLLDSWPCILAMVFLMGLQSTFFSPALNGSIPELYIEEHVAKANGVLKVVTTLAILAGIATAGISLDAAWPMQFGLASSRSLVALVAVLVAFFGFFASFGVYSKPASGNKRPFPKYGPISSLQDAAELFGDHNLRRGILSDVAFYFIASTAVLAINTLGIEQLGFSQTLTSLLSVCLMLGVSIGAVVVSRFFHMERWDRFLVAGSTGMAAGLFLTAATVYLPTSVQTLWIIIVLAGAGFAGGVFLIPITSFLQIYPQSTEKGRVLGTTNFCGFIGIMMSGFVFSGLNAIFSPAGTMAAIGFLALLCSMLLGLGRRSIAKYGARLLLILLSLRYRIEVKGLDKIVKDDTRGTLILPNHPALIDPVLMMSVLLSRGFFPRPLADQAQVTKPFIRQFMYLIKPIIIPDLAVDGRGGKARIVEALAEMAERLKSGDDVLLYPAGRIYRSQYEYVGGNSGVEHLLRKAPAARVILARTTGLWGSSFSRAGGQQPTLLGQAGQALRFLLANVIFFGPRRRLTIEFREESMLGKMTSRSEINSALESFYNRTALPNTHVPYRWWQGNAPVILPEPEEQGMSTVQLEAPAELSQQVLQKIADLSDTKPKLKDMLARDLGMDSLSLMELAAWLEEEYATRIEDTNALVTVEDCVHAAMGIVSRDTQTARPVPDSWFSLKDTPLSSMAGDTVTSLFLGKANSRPDSIIIGDQISGYRSYRDLLTAIFLLKKIISRLQGERVGIMLPAAVSAVITYLATLFACKIPVMYNWTVGSANIASGIETTGTRCIITSKVLYTRLSEQGIALDELDVKWLFLEEVVSKATLLGKLKAAFSARFLARSLPTGKPENTAVILFTSGSESKPKAVPLTHKNLMANLRDIMVLYSFSEKDSLLGMLPPFHSLGLAGTLLLPVCIGLRTVYHANPTESAVLARLTATHKISLVIGTPTFLNGILQAGSNEQLASLRLLLTGAEKCPDSLYSTLKRINPAANLCEGYGITECSPLVSLNTIEGNRPGSIGPPVPSVQHAIINPETGATCSPGERGLLLLRGQNIFSGYLGEDSDKGFRTHNGLKWYDTGDFVSVDTEGYLHFGGRQKRFIKLGGEMISLPAIETVLQYHFPQDDDGRPCCAIEAIGGEEQPEIVFFTTARSTTAEINELIRQAGLSPLCRVRRVMEVEEIPVLGTGKTDYRSLKRVFAERESTR